MQSEGLIPPYIPKGPYPHERGGGGDGVLPPGGSVYPYDARRTVWEAAAGGYTLRVRVDPPAPRGGQVVRFLTEVAAPGGASCCAVATDGGVVDRGNGGCAAGASYDTSIVYNQPGRTPFQVVVYDCTTPQKALVWLLGELEVSEGKGIVQGPKPPRVELAQAGGDPIEHPHDSRYLTIANVFAADDDGWVASLTIDWGDGSPSEVHPGDPTPCRSVAPEGWPDASGFHTRHPVAGSYGFFPYEGPQRWDHYFPNPGTYRVTVTTRSTACDGVSQPQAAVAEKLWTVTP